jgi:hypothetical protein
MVRQEVLNTTTHADLRMRTPSALGRHFVQVVPSEFAAVAARCPLLFTKHADTGRFFVGAVFGFIARENLLVNRDGVLDGAMPFDLEREGFFIARDAVVIDRDSPRFHTDSTPLPGRGDVGLFDAEGQPDVHLRRVQHALASLHRGLEHSERFVAALLDLKLIERIDISLSFDDGERISLEELYTISRDALSDLDDAAIVTLFREGHLQLALTMIDSLAQIPLLARRRNDRLA